MHGRDDLHFIDGIEPEATGDSLGHQVLDEVQGLLGRGALDEEEVTAAALFLEDRHLAPVDPVGVHHDEAFTGLAEDLGEAHHVDRPGTDYVAEHAAGPHRRELVHVAHQDELAAHGHGPEEVV